MYVSSHRFHSGLKMFTCSTFPNYVLCTVSAFPLSSVFIIPQLFASTSAKTIEVSAGDDFEAACLLEVEAGDTCYLAKGTYEHDGLTRVHGTEDARITITGHSEACIKGSGTQDRVLQISHDYYTIENICFDGSHGGDDYTATAIYVLGADKKSTKNGVTSSVTGLIMRNLEIKNFNSECVHFRYFVTHAEVEGCTIQNCGKEAFVNGGGGKVGEAIYLGTALDQVDDNKVRGLITLICLAFLPGVVRHTLCNYCNSNVVV